MFLIADDISFSGSMMKFDNTTSQIRIGMLTLGKLSQTIKNGITLGNFSADNIGSGVTGSIIIGDKAGSQSCSTNYNSGNSNFILIGGLAGGSGSAVELSTAIGYRSMYRGSVNSIAIGVDAMSTMNPSFSSSYNIAIGNRAMSGSGLLSTLSTYNIAIGEDSLRKISSNSSYNVAIGTASLANVTGSCSDNIGIGYYAGRGVSGSNNIYIGSGSGQQVTASSPSSGNVGIGGLSMNAMGNGSGPGQNNTAIGYASFSALQNGQRNSAVGYNAGNSVTNITNVTCLGYNAQPSADNVSDEITLGDANIAHLRCNQQTIESLSDGRDKANIKDSELGLKFIERLRPVKFQWDRREWYENGIRDGSKCKSEYSYGFIAQELLEVANDFQAKSLNLVNDNVPTKLEAAYSTLIPVLVKSIKELSEKVCILEDKIKDMENEK